MAEAYEIIQGSAGYPLVFLLVSSTDHLTGKTGSVPEVAIRKVGGVFAEPDGAVTELGYGWYAVAGSAADSDTLGPLLLQATADGADPSDAKYCVVTEHFRTSPPDPFPFLMIDQTNHIDGLAGLTPTVVISKNGGAFDEPDGVVTEISGGWYQIAGNASDSGTAGPLILHATATGADPTDTLFGLTVALVPDEDSTTLPDFTTPHLCTDEDILIHCGGDYTSLVPNWQIMANGQDGAFLAGSPWVLTSASVDFEDNGVHPGHVIKLTMATNNPDRSYFPGGSGQYFAVDSVDGNAVSLRRPYKDLGAGHPPAPASGLTDIYFIIETLDPNIDEASFDIKQRFGIDENVAGSGSSSVYDLREIRLATVLSVLVDRYTQETRDVGGDFAMKADRFRRLLDQVLDRVNLRWGTTGEVSPSPMFNTRVVRG